MRVIIAVDGSSHSLEAVVQIGLLLSADRDQVTFYYSPPDVFSMESDVGDAAAIDRARSALVKAVVDEARSRLPQALQPRTETIVGDQAPADGILAAAKSCSAGLIVVGARGLGPLEGMLLGSISRSIVHHAEIPVWVARPRPQADRAQFKALLACSDAQGCDWLAGIVNKFTWPAGSVGRIVSVVPPLVGYEVPKWLEDQARQARPEAFSAAWATEHDAELAAKRQSLAASSQRLPEAFRSTAPLVLEGHTSKRILETATSEQVDLIVMGTHVHGALARVVMGSTCETVLSHAPCSVLVQPHRKG